MHITQIVVSNTVTTTHFLLLIYCTYTGHQLRVQIKMIKFLTLMHALLDLQYRVLLKCSHLRCQKLNSKNLIVSLEGLL
jgi:hypothetical protein